VDTDKAKKSQEMAARKKRSSTQGSHSQDSAEQERKCFPEGDSSEGQGHYSTGLALQQIREIASQPTPSTSFPAAKHLLLCVAPLNSRSALPAEDSGFDLIPDNVGCTFTAGIFSLPEDNSHDANADNIICGLNEWDGSHLLTHVFASLPLTLESLLQ
jgi:1-phosphatidylinositol-3-phosphate 5-kinase